MTGTREPIPGTKDPYLYQTQRHNMDAFVVSVPNGSYTVTLKFCEIHCDQPGQRLFGIQLQSQTVLDNLDLFKRAGRYAPLDLSFTNITVSDETLRIGFVRHTGKPCLSAFVIQGHTSPAQDLPSQSYVRKVNCSGLHYRDYGQDLYIERLPDWQRHRTMPVHDLYLDFARANFGPEAAQPVANILARLDGPAMPEPACWFRGGPGHITPNPISWQATRRQYAFVTELANLAPQIRGAGNRERFRYWLSAFRCQAAMAELGCLRGELDQQMSTTTAEPDTDKAKSLARTALDTRLRLARAWENLLDLQLAATDTPAELGTLANFEQHNRRGYNFLNLHDEDLARALGQPLPPETEPTTLFRGPARIILPTVRTQVAPGEPLSLKIIALDDWPMKRASLHWRHLGQGQFTQVNLTHSTRALYHVTLPPAHSDFEYYLETETVDGTKLVWPPTAPALNQTVVVWPAR